MEASIIVLAIFIAVLFGFLLMLLAGVAKKTNELESNLANLADQTKILAKQVLELYEREASKQSKIRPLRTS